MTGHRCDHAERTSLRLFYRNWHPTGLGKVVSGALARLSGLGLTPAILLTLQVRGRRSGRLHTNVLVVTEHDGHRYLVSMLGDGSEWVRNVRATGGEAFVKRGSSRPVRLTEVPAEERAPILKAYCQVATSGRRHFPIPHDAPLTEFRAIAADYPVFRIEPAQREGAVPAPRDRRRSLAAASAVAVAGLAYTAVVRPRIRRWGATDEEVAKALPGDELPSPMGYRPVSTRAITIDAPPDQVWPWLVQMGSGRAGFYTHEWVERLLFITYADGHSATRIHPEWQELHVGDRVPYSRFNTVPVTMVDRPRCLIAGEWLILEPLAGGTKTRLIARTRGGWLEPFARKVPVLWPLLWPIAALIDRGPGEALHHYMESGMLKGIKSRVEAAACQTVPGA
ncbi:MAG TPA: nitroreductase/quinone reductase family protein [bacterium]|nr:nitroreductase/quinone reductase family protein [bacterium]